MRSARIFRVAVLATALLFGSGCAGLSTWVTTPSGKFDETGAPAPPDYGRRSNWAALPAEAAPLPSGEADVFFLHPTTYFWRGGWNGPVDGLLTRIITATTLEGQASAFGPAGRLFAPRFRQMTLSGFDRPAVRAPALELAYSDVRRAFRHYLTHYDLGRPLILAAHSQGSRHLLRLLDEFFVTPPLRGRLVAAYPVGARIWDGPYERGEAAIPVCEEPRQTGCLVGWRSFALGADPSLDHHAGEPSDGRTVCVNPLSWLRDGPKVEAADNLGTIPIPVLGRAAVPKPGLVGAVCREGILWIDPPHGWQYAIAHEGGNYHAYDYELFYANVRSNALERLDAHLERKAVR